ncbi:PRC-barrel domain-containing protein [Sediminimonas qiaohouensis]|uniref:PRC-barrel domain-containing protein n=1 Tax=Sediminimonas qiaohouensis TaxID=552061 RepID=UPI0004046B3D|nr:PRC-barrel domain-containing protein [Sediminimonas qiaohouensis]
MRQILAYSAIVALSATPVLADSHDTAEEDTQSSTTMEQSEEQTDTTAETGQESDTTAESGQESGTSAESGQESSTTTESSQESDTTAESGQNSDMQATELSEEERSQLTAEQLMGQSVYDANGNEVGDIGEVLMNGDGESTEVVIEVGGFLGIGEKPVAVALKDLTISRSDGASSALRIETAHTEEDLDSMPEWKGEA